MTARATASAPSGSDPCGTNGDDIAQDWEIGPSGNANFGTRSTNRPDDDLKRGYYDVMTASLQQEVADGVSVTLQWRHRSSHDSYSGDNQFRSFDDFLVSGTTLEFARPAPYVGTIQVFNVDPSVRSLIDNVDRTRPDGSYSRIYNGVELSANARLRGGGTLLGGWTVERLSIDDCGDQRATGDNPNDLRFCDQNAFPHPYIHEFKISGSYPFSVPWLGALQIAGSFRAQPGGRGWDSNVREGFRISRSGGLQAAGNNQAIYGAPWYTVENCFAPCVPGANIVDRGVHPTIGTSTSNTDVILLPGDSVKFYPYWNQLDVNLAKVFTIGSWRYDARVEVFNALNSGVHMSHQSAGLGRGTGLGRQFSSFERADVVLDGRVIRLAMTARF